MRGPLVVCLLVALVVPSFPGAASSEEACPDDFVVIQEVAGSPLARVGANMTGPWNASSACATLLPTTERVRAAWSHDVPGERGLAVLVEGEGVEPFRLPVAALRLHRLGEGDLVRYETDPFDLPAGLKGALRVTLLQDGAPLRTTSIGPAG